MRTTRWVGAAVVLAGAGWAAGRIARGPARVDIRAFDPDEVARLETAMWRSYYDRRRLPLFGQLVALLRGQFQLSPARSLALAFLAARAAAVFQVGRDHADYQRALPYLERYYAAILAVSEAPFDAAEVARLELDWWVVHREASGELERALAALAAALYRVPAGRLTVHAERRAEAMTLRDQRAREPGGVAEADWERIEALLRLAWRSLAAEVRAGEPAR